MRCWRTTGAALFLAIFLSACSRQPILFVVNNTPVTITVLHVTATGDQSEMPERSFLENVFGRPFEIKPRRSRELIQSSWAPEQRNWNIEIQTASCRLWFSIPVDVSWEYQSSGWAEWRTGGNHDGDPTVQLEADQTLHLVPGGVANAVDASDFASLQPAGFPLAPTESNCDP